VDALLLAVTLKTELAVFAVRLFEALALLTAALLEELALGLGTGKATADTAYAVTTAP